ncbi:MAG: P-loop NTPase fold protein [Clostridia bacterium]
MSKIGYTDRPVEQLDEDSFGIKTYIDGLCEFIVSCDTPMTISIQGDWGSGKTSMMNMIKKVVDDQVHTIWFNTWQYSQFNMGQELCISFLENLIGKLHSKAENRNEKILESSLKILKIGAKTALSAIGLDGGAVVDVFNKEAADLAKAVSDLKDAFQECVDDKLKEVKKDRVVIFVDDLDRLNPAKAVELLEVLKVFLDCKNCVFILAVDYNVVTAGVRQKFGDMVGDEKGKSFFDKIIQLPFKMPVAHYDIKKYIKDMLQKMDICTDARTIKDYQRLIRSSIGFNPRSIKRLFNTYQLLNIISKTNDANINESVRQRLLFATICMQMSLDHLYSMIVSCSRSDELTSKVLLSLTDPDLVRDYDELPEELGLLDADKKIDEAKLSKTCSFMKAFVDAVDLDKSKELSETEIDNLKEILSFSSVTSVVEVANDTGESVEEHKLRHRNRHIIDEVDARLLDTIGDFLIWQPRKARGEVKLSDVSSYIDTLSAKGTPYTFEFYITSKGPDMFGFSMKLYSQAFPQRLVEEFGKNPLERDTLPVMDEMGFCYIGMEVPVCDSVGRITAEVQTAHDKLKEKALI